ncbi:uncharacterized protein TNIN_140551 [Trichonephila inaurata madagascariensis]|uniref:Uncharacterized protein n=1 Tax=Trichonephila inaurata madagascariensis TaxID=2747483 RepID=A0A8X6Y9W6_9ARAC|nr:uncharacterized protein TNIN_140551 [Trichonephila inaurata madagascariensis]
MLGDHNEMCPFIPLLKQEQQRNVDLKAAIPVLKAKLKDAEERLQFDVAGVAQWIHLFPSTFEKVLKDFLDDHYYRPGEPFTEEEEAELEKKLTGSLKSTAQHKRYEYNKLKDVIEKLDEEKANIDTVLQEVTLKVIAYDTELQRLLEQARDCRIAERTYDLQFQKLYRIYFPSEESFDQLSQKFEDRLNKAAELGIVLPPRSPVRSPFSPKA